MTKTPPGTPAAEEPPAAEPIAEIDPVDVFMRPGLITHETKAAEPDKKTERRSK
jgi:hypothetical protein